MCPKTHTLLFDTDTQRPGCVILQALMGGDSELVQRLWSSWQTEMVPTLVVVTGTREQWEAVAAGTITVRGGSPPKEAL